MTLFYSPSEEDQGKRKGIRFRVFDLINCLMLQFQTVLPEKLFQRRNELYFAKWWVHFFMGQIRLCRKSVDYFLSLMNKVIHNSMSTITLMTFYSTTKRRFQIKRTPFNQSLGTNTWCSPKKWLHIVDLL